MQANVEKRISQLAVSAGFLRDACNSELDILQNITFEKHQHGATILGNRSGLVELARTILEVASGDQHHADIDTQRLHLDRTAF